MRVELCILGGVMFRDLQRPPGEELGAPPDVQKKFLANVQYFLQEGEEEEGGRWGWECDECMEGCEGEMGGYREGSVYMLMYYAPHWLVMHSTCMYVAVCAASVHT